MNSGHLALTPGASKTDRINLLDSGGLDELMFMGWKLAEFLDVPFLDHRTLEEEGGHPQSFAKHATASGDASEQASPPLPDSGR